MCSPTQQPRNIVAAASQAAAERAEVQRFLSKRFERLNEEYPQVPLATAAAKLPCGATNHQKQSGVVVDVEAVVDTDEAWGKLDYRRQAYANIVQGLIQAYDRNNYAPWLRQMTSSGPYVEEVPGVYGPLYYVTTDGRHRVHTLRALGLGNFPMEVSTGLHPPATAGATLVLPAQPVGGLGRKAHYNTLEDYGVIDIVNEQRSGSASQIAHVTCVLQRDLPANWALASPKLVSRIAQSYAHAYPAFRNSGWYEVMSDPRAWKSWLKSGQ